MNVEELITRSADGVASDVTPPPTPDPRELGQRAVSLQRRRRVGAAVAATVVAVTAAAVLVPTFAGRESRTEPVEQPSYEPLGNVPAWVDPEGDVHVGEQVVDLSEEVPDNAAGWYEVLTRFSLTETGVVWSRSENPTHPFDDTWPGTPLYWQAPGGERMELTGERIQYFTSDPAGDHVVWVTAEREMVTYDLAERRVVDTRALELIVHDPDVLAAGPPIVSVDADEVVYKSGTDVFRLDLEGGTAARIPDVSAGDLLDYGGGVAVVAASALLDRGVGNSGRSLAQLEFRSADGTVQAEPHRLFREGRLSPDGRWFVTSTGYEAGLRTVVLDTSTGKQVDLDLPDKHRAGYADPWGWAGSDVLIVGLTRPVGGTRVVEDLWACRPTTGTCERLRGAASLTYPW